MLYKGNAKIRDEVSYGVYAGSRPIKEIYHGSNLVYQWHPYAPNTLIYNLTGEATRTITLPWGVYSLAITGGGGPFNSWAATGYPWIANGASGATWEGLFYISSSQTITLYAGGIQTGSYLNFGSTRMITAGAGGKGGTSGSGKGGTLTVSSALNIVSTSISTNGKNGSTWAGTGYRDGAASTSSYGWGMGEVATKGNVVVGGFRLEFIRRKP